jgi:hypothetical protein
MKTILLCAIAFTTVGCAGSETGTDTGGYVEREYTTGSNIPRKNRVGDGVQVLDKEALHRALDQAPAPTPTTSSTGR